MERVERITCETVDHNFFASLNANEEQTAQVVLDCFRWAFSGWTEARWMEVRDLIVAGLVADDERDALDYWRQISELAQAERAT